MSGNDGDQAMTGASDSPTEARQWLHLWQQISTGSLTPLDRMPVIPAGTPPSLFAPIHQAYGAGVQSARGVPNTIRPPVVDNATEVCWSYFNMGYRYGLSQPSLLLNSNHAPSRRVKVAPPKLYDGNRDEFDNFLTSLHLMFNSDPSLYNSDHTKINTTATYLTGAASAWFRPNLIKDTGKFTWERFDDFVVSLKAAFDNPDARATAERKLNSLKQGPKDCSQYHAEFATLVSQLDLSQQSQISRFREGLTYKVKQALVSIISPPTTFDSFAQLCITLDNNLRLLEGYKPAKPYFRTTFANSPTTASGTEPGPMDLTQTRRGPITPEMKKYRRDNNLCLYCGKTGHYAFSCPATKRINTTGRGNSAPPWEKTTPLIYEQKN